MANINNHAPRFRKGLSNPFDHGAGPMYCPTCKIDVAYETMHHHQGTTYAYKRRCKRCGGVLARGVFDNVVMITGKMPEAAMEWSEEKGEDRR